MSLILKWIVALWQALLHIGDYFSSLPDYVEAPVDVALSRIKTCGTCSELEVDTRQCQVCFCFVSLKVKDANQSCPLNKWGAIMKASNEALTIIKYFEGFSAKPYKDITGTWTIGYGHTGPGTENMGPLTVAEATTLLDTDLQPVVNGINKFVTVALTQDRFDALCSFTYNLGLAALEGSTLLRLLNEGNYAGAAGQFPLWDHAGGVVVEGLLIRRTAEQELFNGKIPVLDENAGFLGNVKIA